MVQVRREIVDLDKHARNDDGQSIKVPIIDKDKSLQKSILFLQ